MTNKLAVRILLGTGAARAQSARVEPLIRWLNDAGMPRSAMVLLAALATDESQSDEVRSAAGAMLAARSGGDPAVAQILLAQGSDPGKPPPFLALQLARGHLERALQLAPPEEGVAFETPPGPQLQPAAAEAPRGPPPAALHELDPTRALLASIPAGAPEEPDAHAMAGLAALAAGDSSGAANQFLALAQLPAKGAEATQRRDQALLQLA